MMSITTPAITRYTANGNRLTLGRIRIKNFIDRNANRKDSTNPAANAGTSEAERRLHRNNKREISRRFKSDTGNQSADHTGTGARHTGYQRQALKNTDGQCLPECDAFAAFRVRMCQAFSKYHHRTADNQCHGYRMHIEEGFADRFIKQKAREQYRQHRRRHDRIGKALSAVSCFLNLPGAGISCLNCSGYRNSAPLMAPN
ncbi:hypothetical protein CHS0354_018450 [Potamilus streckersoni]|uniref:Uncharacterized protein n=1 Tax=Potamilus streckersoni TaxID=2493646 RepID=A0AAE0W9Y3_9BIVA|nr:hypothetical protein CHS0354_018450 [Potamilus streckersoni]